MLRKRCFLSCSCHIDLPFWIVVFEFYMVIIHLIQRRRTEQLEMLYFTYDVVNIALATENSKDTACLLNSLL